MVKGRFLLNDGQPWTVGLHEICIRGGKLGDYRVYYITRGAVRGPCEHKHRTVEYAYHCLRHDIQACQKEGKVSDRRIYAQEDGKERELVEREIYELDYAKRLMLGKTVLKQEQKELKLSQGTDGSG